jgi:hypothetical protein
MIAAIVAPLGSLSIFNTADCLEVDDVGAFDDAVLDALVLAAGFDRAEILLLARRLALRGVFTDFDFDLLVAIWHSLGSSTASGAATDTSPQKP